MLEDRIPQDPGLAIAFLARRVDTQEQSLLELAKIVQRLVGLVEHELHDNLLDVLAQKTDTGG